VATCTATVGTRVCASGVCDPKDNACGLADGDGPCAAGDVCRSLNCNPFTKECVATPICTKAAQCPTGEACVAGECVPRVPDGSACTTSDECQSGDCESGVCNSIVATGAGPCAASPSAPGGEGGGRAALLGLLLAACGLRRRRRVSPAA
jgi:hypothetical protein